jgi:hypothetical protein
MHCLCFMSLPFPLPTTSDSIRLLSIALGLIDWQCYVLIIAWQGRIAFLSQESIFTQVFINIGNVFRYIELDEPVYVQTILNSHFHDIAIVGN